MMIDFSSVFTVAAFAALVPFVYMMLRVAGLALTARHRRDLARFGEEFLARDDATESQKSMARLWLNDPFTGHMAWVMVAFAPVVLVMVFALSIVRLLRMQEPTVANARATDCEKALRTVSKRGFVASLGASPVAAILFFLELAILAPVRVLRSSFVKSPGGDISQRLE